MFFSLLNSLCGQFEFDMAGLEDLHRSLRDPKQIIIGQLIFLGSGVS